VTEARPYARARNPEVAAAVQTSKANIDRLERRCAAIERRLDVLEARDDWFRSTFYPYLVTLAAAVPFAGPPDLPP